MVLLIVQPGTAAQNEYCYAATRDTSVDVISRDLARLWNLQQRIRRLAAAMKAMSNHGWTRPLNMQGLTLDQVREYNMGHILGPVEDLFAKRCGNPPCAEAQATLVRTADEALETFSPNKTKRREPLDEKHMLRAIELCGGAVTIAYPMGIPEYDEVAHCLKDTEELAGTADSKTVLDEETCVVWFAGKMMAREQTLGKFVSAENATCKVRIQPRGSVIIIRASPHKFSLPFTEKRTNYLCMN
jgi:hypothetical protein